jgi:predicted dehydrogenase
MGLGWGYRHLASYRELIDKVDLYICDMDHEKLRKAQDEFHIAGVFNDIDEALDSEKVDAVDIALPHQMHMPVTVKAAQKGKHITIIKPIARTLDEADRMISAAKRAGVKLMVTEGMWFHPGVIKARGIIDEGAVGDVFMIRVHCCVYIDWTGGWRAVREYMGGGHLIDSGIHFVNILRHLCPVDVDSVFSRCLKIDDEKSDILENTTLTNVKFKNGAVGDLIVSMKVRQQGPNTEFCVYGTEGSLWFSNQPPVGLTLHSIKLEGYNEPKTLDWQSLCDEDYESMHQHFVNCIMEDREPTMSGEEGRKDLEVVLAAYRAHDIGMDVKLPLIS